MDISTHGGNVNVQDVESAKHMITTTLFYHQLEPEEITLFPDANKLIQHFSLDVGLIQKKPNPSIGESEQGYPFVYEWT